MKKFEALSKQIDAVIEILKKDDLTAQDGLNIAFTVLEWDKEYGGALTLPVREATSVGFILSHDPEKYGESLKDSKEHLSSKLKTLQKEYLTYDRLNSMKAWALQDRIGHRKDTPSQKYLAEYNSFVGDIDKLLAFN